MKSESWGGSVGRYWRDLWIGIRKGERESEEEAETDELHLDSIESRYLGRRDAEGGNISSRAQVEM